MTSLAAPRRPDQRRMLIVDGAIAAGLAAMIVIATDDAAVAQGFPVPDLLGYALLLVSAVSVAVRRLVPLATFAVTVAASTVYFAAGYPIGPGVYPVLVATYTVASRLPLRKSAIVCGSAMVGSAATLALTWALFPHAGASRSVIGMVSWAGWLVLPWAVGALVRTQREQVAREQLAAVRYREEDLRRHAAEERLRVARELHDSVGHNLAVIAMQAGVALHILEQRPEHAREALTAIRSQSKDALDSLRGALDVFRNPEEDHPDENHPSPDQSSTDQSGTDRPGTHAPAAGLDQLDALLDRTRGAGMSVSVTTVGEPVPLPAVIDHAAYRIVQESLTNALRHGGTDQAHVELRYDGAALELTIVDGGRSPVPTPRRASDERAFAPGHGISGMRERALAVGGSFSADRRADGFAVTVRLPCLRGTRVSPS